MIHAKVSGLVVDLFLSHILSKETETMGNILPSSEVGHGQGGKPKKKRKERSKEHNKQPTVNE